MNEFEKWHRRRNGLAEMGPYEKALENVKSGKTQEQNTLQRKKEMEQLTKTADDLSKDITDFIVRKRYGHLFSK